MRRNRLILKNFTETVKASLPDTVKPAQVDIWFQDESRVGQQGSTTRQWAEKGSRPRAIRQQQFEYAYLYGAVCPARGEAVGIVMPSVNMASMQLHLDLISAQIPEGRHAVLVVDGAGWHSNKLSAPNITLLKLPPYSPELNPVEQVWLALKQNKLSNRAYKHYDAIVDAIVDACCEAWNEFAENEEWIRRLCSRKWAKVC